MGAVAVLPARPGTEGGDVALGLAAALAGLNRSVCLVEPHRRTELTARFGTDPAADLMDLLAGRPACLDLRIARPQTLPRLAWVAAAPDRSLLLRLRGRFQHVVISAEPAPPRGVDRALLAVRHEPGALAAARRVLAAWPAGAPPVLAVLAGYYPDLAGQGVLPAWAAVQEQLGVSLAAVVPRAPDGPAGTDRAYRHLAQRLLGRPVPLAQDIAPPPGLLGRLLGWRS